MQHILFVFRSLGTGGSQKVQAFVANACIKKGYSVSIISMSNETCSLDIDSNIKIYTLDYDLISATRNNRLKYYINQIKYIINFRKLCKKINPDLICVFLIDIVRLTVVALKGTSFPIIGSERADPSQFSKKKIQQYNKALNKCVGIVYQLEEASKYYNVNPNILQEVIPNPAIIRNTNQMTNQTGNEELFIFSGGRLSKQKRFDVLINAYDIIADRYPEYRLKIYGDGPELSNLKKQAFELGLIDNIDFMGNVKNIFQDTNKDSIFVLSSDYEGIPNVITEALIHGVPCIATDCSPGGARLLLDNGRGGDVVECGNPTELSESIIRYIENPEYAKSKATYGKKYIKEFDPKTIENIWLDFIERIIKSEKI